MFILLATGLTSFITYIGARLIEKTEKEEKRKGRLLLSGFVAIILGFLVFVKLYTFNGWTLSFFIVPVGISYYTFSLISYLADVYWKRDQAERNYFKLALFVLFFPKILQGPISRHRYLSVQLLQGNRFSFKNISFGSQLIIWGLFKKLVIADRAVILVNNVYGNLADYRNSGAILCVVMVFSAIQLYCDFSGYTDMARGISQMFGICLEENFNHPFFAKSSGEFWQRWHMTLSGWFKDYLFLPISRSKYVKKISKSAGKRFGATARKNTIIIIASSIVWLATGLWHGTGINYVVWGAYWGFLIIFSEVFAPQIEKVNNFLRINTQAATWKWFQMLRTFGIFCVGKMISAQDNLQEVKLIIRAIIKSLNPSELLTGKIYELGLSRANIYVLVFGLIILWGTSLLQEKGCIREKIADWNMIPRCIFYGLSILTVILFSVYGSGYDTSTFAYQFF